MLISQDVERIVAQRSTEPFSETALHAVYLSLIHILLFSPDQFGARDDVRPLVIAARLEAAAVRTEELEEVVRLKHHIVKLKKRQSAVEPLLVTVGAEHSIDGKMRSRCV